MRVSHGRGSKNEGFGIHLVWGAPREGHKVLLKHVLRHARAACASPCREWFNTPGATSARRILGSVSQQRIKNPRIPGLEVLDDLKDCKDWRIGSRGSNTPLGTANL